MPSNPYYLPLGSVDPHTCVFGKTKGIGGLGGKLILHNRGGKRGYVLLNANDIKANKVTSYFKTFYPSETFFKRGAGVVKKVILYSKGGGGSSLP